MPICENRCSYPHPASVQRTGCPDAVTGLPPALRPPYPPTACLVAPRTIGALGAIDVCHVRRQIQRKSPPPAKTGPVWVQKRTIFQALARQIRYSMDQRNSSRDQRIKAAVTTEKQRKFGGVENSEIAPAGRRSIGGPGRGPGTSPANLAAPACRSLTPQKGGRLLTKSHGRPHAGGTASWLASRRAIAA